MKKAIMRSKRLIIVFAFLLVLTPMTALANSGEKEQLNYISLGDSLAAGLLFNRETGPGYVGPIVDELELKGYHVNASNKGVAGATSADVLAGIATIPELAEADIVTISAGANDILGKLDMAKIGEFDPVYLNPEAVIQLQEAAETTALSLLSSVVEVADESIAEASINVEAVDIAVTELVKKATPYDTFLPADVKNALTAFSTELHLGQVAVDEAKGLTVHEIDVETIATAIETKNGLLEDATRSMDRVIENIEVIESALASIPFEFPGLDEVAVHVDTVRALTSIAILDMERAIQAFDQAHPAIDAYQAQLAEISRFAANAEEVMQMMAMIPDEVAAVGQRIAETVMTIKQINPDAVVYVLGYYNALPYLSTELQQQVTIPLLTGLNEATQTAAQMTGAIFVPSFELFSGKESAYLPNPADIHPNEAGYQAIAGAFMSQISESFQGPTVPPNDEGDADNEVPPVNEEGSDEELPPENEETTEDEGPAVIEEDPKNVVPTSHDETAALVEDEHIKSGAINQVEVNSIAQNRLPNTATNHYVWFVLGSFLLIIGSSLWLLKSKQTKVSH